MTKIETMNHQSMNTLRMDVWMLHGPLWIIAGGVYDIPLFTFVCWIVAGGVMLGAFVRMYDGDEGKGNE